MHGKVSVLPLYTSPLVPHTIFWNQNQTLLIRNKYLNSKRPSTLFNKNHLFPIPTVIEKFLLIILFELKSNIQKFRSFLMDKENHCNFRGFLQNKKDLMNLSKKRINLNKKRINLSKKRMFLNYSWKWVGLVLEDFPRNNFSCWH